MSKSKTQTTPAPQTSGRYDVFVVDTFTGRDNQEKTNWMRVGVAFPHKDGQGFNLELRAVPTDGKLVIRVHEDKPE